MASGQSLAPLGAAIPVAQNLKNLNRATAQGVGGKEMEETTANISATLSKSNKLPMNFVKQIYGSLEHEFKTNKGYLPDFHH